MSERDDKDQTWSEATLWFARMRSPDAGEFRPQFEEWLSRGALHRRYYNRASEHWLHGTAAFAEERARIHGGEDRRPEPPRDNRNKRGVTAAVVAASLLVAVSTVLVVARTDYGDSEPQIAVTQLPTRPMQLATTKSERRAARLGDGSLVTLGESTLLQVQLANDVRRLQLDRGNARFDVAHEPRPFVVFAGGGSITAHGTIFDVGLSPSHQVSVRLIRGSVEVSFPVRATTTARALHRTLHPGETISFEAPAAAQLPPDIARDYRDARLADIVGEANRGAAVPIRVASPAIGARLVSGRFRTDDTALLAERLGTLFDLDVDRSSKTEIVLRSK
jgi:transmembrane sensor